MISHFRKLIALPLALLLTLPLSGCDGLAYREAIDLYNAQEYAQAAELFSQLGDYEDSSALFTRSRYWEAVVLMEQGDYSAAQPRFVKLGDYEDCPQRLLECRYQLAVAAFESGDYDQAEKDFLEFADYRNTPEYLRQINWQKFYAYVQESGQLTTQREDLTVQVLADSGTLTLTSLWEKDLGYTFRDDLSISLTRDSFEAVFIANSAFTMDFNGSQIGSSQVAEGRFSVTQCTWDMELVPDSFRMTVTDNQGKVTNSTDPADSTMFEAMQENYTAIMDAFPRLLADSGLNITPADLGFDNLA